MFPQEHQHFGLKSGFVFTAETTLHTLSLCKQLSKIKYMKETKQF